MDIFISYATEDRAVARQLAQLLESRGWSVWWDHHIRAGETFDNVIERELDCAGCVVVLWSASSIASEWVRNEAASAAEAGVLIPALIEAVKPPLEFRRRQNVDLVGWNPADGHDERLLRLFDAIAEALGNDGVAPPPIEQPVPADPVRPARRSPNKAVMLSAALLAAALLGWGAAELRRGDDDRSAPASAAPAPDSGSQHSATNTADAPTRRPRAPLADTGSGESSPLQAGVLQVDWPGSDCWAVYRSEARAGGGCGSAKLALQAGDYVLKPIGNTFEPISLRVEANQVVRIHANAGFFEFNWPGSDCWAVYRGEKRAAIGCGAKRLALQAGIYVLKSVENVFGPMSLRVEAGRVSRVDGNAGFLDFRWPGSDCWVVNRGEERATSGCGAKKIALQAGDYIVKSTGNAFLPTPILIRHGQTTTLP